MLSRRIGRSSVMLLMLLTVLLAASFAGAEPAADSAILFIGDGMGPTHVELAELAACGRPLAIRGMPFSGTATTLEAEGYVTDSAAAGTALSTGYKTKDGMIGVSPDNEPLETLLEHCRKLGKSTGVITTDDLTGATPATFYAHVDDRGKSEEIANQLVRSDVPVLLGFWKTWMVPESAGGKRTDERDLIAHMRQSGYEVLLTPKDLKQATSPKLLGLFDDDNGLPAPSLAEMVQAALDRLAQNPKGFFLIVEEARIDWSAHVPAAVVQRTRMLDEAVRVSLDVARRRGRTLVVVTGDHETGGLDVRDRTRAATLCHVKASEEEMSWRVNEDRTNLTEVLAEYAGVSDLTDAELDAMKAGLDLVESIAAVLNERGGVAWTAEDHTDTPVGVYAFGPGAESFTGAMDNTDVPRRVARALGLEMLAQPGCAASASTAACSAASAP